MEKSLTSPPLQRRILEHLNAWVSHSEPPALGNNTKLRLALLEQDSIGWYQFVLGLHSSRFADIQHQYFISINKKNTGLRWTTLLIQKLLDVAWDMWQQRNNVLKKSPHELFLIDEMAAADAAIDEEFTNGTRQLIGRDKQLLRSKRKIKAMTLEQKQVWIVTVDLAREAYKAKLADTRSRAARTNLQGERTRMSTWLAGRQPANPLQPPALP